MEIVTANTAGRSYRAHLNGRSYRVVPLTLIVPGVLNGSQGALFYPPEEVGAEPHVWNHVPLVAYHPYRNGAPVSARDPLVLAQQGLGFVFRSRYTDRLGAEGWFDEDLTRQFDRRLKADVQILPRLEAGTAIELSTGVFTNNEAAPAGAAFNGKPYGWVARNYRPDHLAILPDQVGACSLTDGCGVLVNTVEGLTMATRGDNITWLTANCDCWKGQGDQALLNTLTDEKLLALRQAAEKGQRQLAVVNAAREGFGLPALAANAEMAPEEMIRTCKELLGKIPPPEAPPRPAPAAPAAPPHAPPPGYPARNAAEPPPITQPAAQPPVAKALTDQEWLTSAPPGVRAVVENALRREEEEKDVLIARLTERVADAGQKQLAANYLKTLPLAQVKFMASLAPAPAANQQQAPAPLFALASAPGGTQPQPDEDLLVPPVINWSEKAAS